MNVQEIQARIDKEKAKLSSDKSLLSKLGGDRAKLAIQGSEKSAQTISRLDKQMDTLRKDIENSPAILSELENQLVTAQAKVAEKQREELLEQQKSVAESMADTSKKLVDALEVANNLNLQLVAAATRYTALKEQTGQDVLVKPTCRPSEQMLKVIYETLAAEFQGEPQTSRQHGQPPYMRI